MKGYKGFDKDFKCRDMQYAENQMFEEEVEPSLCNRGLHFCAMPLDVFDFYPPDGKNIFANVESKDRMVSDDKKSVTNKLQVNAKLNISGMFKAHFSLVCEKIRTSSNTQNTSGDNAHANTSGWKSHANTSGDNAHANTSGWKSHANTSGDNAHANTSGDNAHANTSGWKSHANTSGDNAIACALGIQSKAKAVNGWIIIVDWQQDENSNWVIKNIHNSKVGGIILDTEIKPDIFYWFENGILKEGV
jgi:hypothetical protein